MTSISSRPLPHLPFETQAHILRFCDRPTLAVSSRVSLAWLELAGPILYEHVTVRGREQLEMMIRTEPVLASIAPFVSLDQTRMFTYAPLTDMDAKSADISQPIASAPVQIEDLVIDMREKTDPGFVHIHVLLASFSPCYLHLLAQPACEDRVQVDFSLPEDLGWFRLRKMTFVNEITSDLLLWHATSPDRSFLLDLEYDISRPGPESDDLEKTLEIIREDLIRWPVADDPSQRAFGHIQVWVADEKEVALARKILVDCSCTSIDIGVKLPAQA